MREVNQANACPKYRISSIFNIKKSMKLAPAPLTPVQQDLANTTASRTIAIEWRHLDVNGATCIRCSETGKTLQQVIEQLAKEFAPQGVQVRFIETRLGEQAIAQSNQILFNGVPLENVLAEVSVSSNACGSCSQLTQRETYCRTVEYEGKIYAEVPESIIRKAALKAIGIAD